MADTTEKDAGTFLDGGNKIWSAIRKNDEEGMWDAGIGMGVDLIANATGTGTIKKAIDATSNLVGGPSIAQVVKYTNPAYLASRATRAMNADHQQQILAGQGLAAHPGMVPRGLQDMIGVPEAQQTNGIRSGAEFIDAMHGVMPAAAPAPVAPPPVDHSGPHASFSHEGIYESVLHASRTGASGALSQDSIYNSVF
jgi:hypothetical protein